MRGQKKLLLYYEKGVIKGRGSSERPCRHYSNHFGHLIQFGSLPEQKTLWIRAFSATTRRFNLISNRFWRGIYREQFDTWQSVKVMGIHRTRNRVNAPLLIFCARIGQPHENSADPYSIHLIQENPIFLANEFQGAARNTIPGWAGLSW